ncbi:hypothetical protein V2J09_007615 [Rumex salicifolius]
MNSHHQNTQFCHYHPKQFLDGVCPFCLHEKLLVVAAKQICLKKHHQTSHSRKSSHVSLPKIFAFGSLLGRHHHNRQQTFYDCDEDGGFSDTQSTSSSLEENGIGLWEKSEVSKASQDQTSTINANASTKNHNRSLLRLSSWRSSSHKSIVELSNTPRGSLRWRKRIGQFLQLVRLKRPNNNKNKGNSGVSHVDGLGSVKLRNKDSFLPLASVPQSDPSVPLIS